MGAIFGILRFDGGAASARDLERMGNVLAHRGPDGRKCVTDGPAGLGHCLMRVNQEDLFEAQPLYDRESNLTLVADCRIDNREELAVTFNIDASALRDMPDSALVLRAYKKWGEHCAEHLLGDFVFAVWDSRERKLVLARDHMGQRGAYYYHDRDFFAFATEVKAFWAVPDLPQVPDDDIIAWHLMQDRRPNPGRTYFKGVFGLGAARVMTITADGRATQRAYWEPHADAAHLDQPEAYYVEAYRAVLGEAVACRLRRTERPAGLAFSGGFDSTAIAALAEPVVRSQGRKLVAVSSTMPIGADLPGDARPWVDLCARHMPHLDVHHVTREGHNLFTDMEKIWWAADAPCTAAAYAMQALFDRMGASGVRLVMDGHGGDYTLNPRGHGTLARFLATGQLRRFIHELRCYRKITGRSLWRTLRTEIVGVFFQSRAMGRKRALRSAVRRSMIADEFLARANREPTGFFDESVEQSENPLRMREEMLDVLRRIMALPAPTFLAHAHGLTMTRPFHDKRVVELALAIPEDLYVKDGRSRYLACRALQAAYPPEFATRSRRNDGVAPDFNAMAERAIPDVIAQTLRMEGDPELSRYVDFAKVRRRLAIQKVRPSDKDDVMWALNAFYFARYMEWMRARNR